MASLKPRTLFRIVSLFIMVVLMVGFVGTMANAYIDSIQCISTGIDACEPAQTSPNTSVVFSADQNAGTDEWLCSIGETSYCASSSELAVALQSR